MFWHLNFVFESYPESVWQGNFACSPNNSICSYTGKAVFVHSGWLMSWKKKHHHFTVILYLLCLFVHVGMWLLGCRDPYAAFLQRFCILKSCCLSEIADSAIAGTCKSNPLIYIGCQWRSKSTLTGWTINVGLDLSYRNIIITRFSWFLLHLCQNIIVQAAGPFYAVLKCLFRYKFVFSFERNA